MFTLMFCTFLSEGITLALSSSCLTETPLGTPFQGIHRIGQEMLEFLKQVGLVAEEHRDLERDR
jgi:hypothetical protein